MTTKTAITPTRQENFAEWYQQVVKAADMAENSVVRGCMVIKPWGYGLWENIQRVFDKRFKETGHSNAYFPLLIPLSFLEKEADHVDGFAKECAVVTHHRLVADGKGGLKPDGELEEPLIIRPTSETIIGESFAKWIQSYRDLPLKINQWCNVMRWEMRTRLFLRTSEFLWQEGHTAHADEADARAETDQMLWIYHDTMRDYLAMPTFPGAKSPSERFAGAVDTYTCEAMMQDGKAVQAGTSHYLGQNFAKAAGIQFLDKDGQQKFAHTTSWGVSTRMIGAMIMTHADDDGMVMPPRVAPAHVVIIPMLKPDTADKVLDFCHSLKKQLVEQQYYGRNIDVIVDASDDRGRGWNWIKKGVPLRIEVGAREVEQGMVSLGRRDLPHTEKRSLTVAELMACLPQELDAMHNALVAKSLERMKKGLVEISTKEEFYKFFAEGKDSTFALVHWNGDAALEASLKQELGVTTRCLPFAEKTPGKCIFTGEHSPQRVIFAKAY